MTKKHVFYLFGVTLTAVNLFFFLNSTISSGDYVLYISDKNSSDRNDGLSLADSIRTLDRAQEILRNVRPNSNVRVIIRGGEYFCRGLKNDVVWTYNNPPYTVSIQGTPRNGQQPIFYGQDEEGKNCKNSVWFSIKHGKEKVGLSISGLKVTGYRGAISITGFSIVPSRIDNGIKIFNNIFENIGDMYFRSPTAGKGAILLEATNGNEIYNNKFLKIQNIDKTAGLIHGIYFTRLSSRNKINNNIFDTISGSAIKLTHYSNKNIFTKNTFNHSPAALVDRWCGAKEDPFKICRNDEAECPSWENIFDTTHQSEFKNKFGPKVNPIIIYPIPSGQVCDYNEQSIRKRVFFQFKP